MFTFRKSRGSFGTTSSVGKVPNKWLIAIVVIVPTFIEVVDTSVVNVALDHIRGSLSAGIDEATWAITAYLVSNAIVIPLSGWLSRVFGRRNYLIFSISLFTVSSFFCGMAWNLSSLIFFRVLQGIGGGALQPISQTILLETFPPKEHGMAMAVFGIGVICAPILGPILGGWITDNWSWHWIFFINIPIGMASIGLVAAFIKDPTYLNRVALNRIDYWGLILISLGLGCLQVVLDKGQQEDWFSSSFIITLAALAVASLVAFIIVELKSKEPVVDLRVFRNFAFASGNAIMFITFFVLFGTIVLMPIYMQKLLGYNALLAGQAIAAGGIAMIFVMPVIGKLVTKVSPKVILLAGLVVCAYSTWILTGINLSTTFEYMVWARALQGVGLGMVFITLTGLTLSSVPKHEMGNATAVYNLLRNLGGSFGVAFVTTVIAQRSQYHQARYLEQANPYDPQYQAALAHIGSLPQVRAAGDASAAMTAHAVIFQKALVQASLFSFVDTFFLCTVLLIAIIPLVLFLRRPKYQQDPIAAH
ncbi:MAG: DHA2 family efflux MFS transporter permease subunit [Candidatus Omnitrophica bacterium]|nr:DHA2 family efflux MFS transporter permease subunit [Candidatus Omnitrophota bacterium]